MATVLFSVKPGGNEGDFSATTGSATVSKSVEVTADMGNVVNKDGSTRPMTKNEFLLALEAVSRYVLKGNWPL